MRSDPQFSAPVKKLQRKCAKCSQSGCTCEDEQKQMKSEAGMRGTKPCAGGANAFDPTSGGQPLPAEVRRAMESRFQFDFSAVRVHTDSAATNSARAEGAHAYTIGRHIVFGHSKYAPSTVAGQGLLAHELAHVVQQAKGVALGSPAERAAAEDRADAAAESPGGAAMPFLLRPAAVPAAMPFVIQRNADCDAAETPLPFDFTFDITEEIYSRSFAIPETATSVTVEIEAAYSGTAPPNPGDVCVQIFGCRWGPDTQTDKQCTSIGGRRATLTFTDISAGRISYLRIWKGAIDGLEISGSGRVSL